MGSDQAGDADFYHIKDKDQIRTRLSGGSDFCGVSVFVVALEAVF
jgi:hypothetical protein